MSRITDEMYASIPGLVAQELSIKQIAERFGVTPNTLKVYCSGRGISLRRGGRRQPATRIAMPLGLSAYTVRSLQAAAKATGRNNSERLIADLLERIATDGLYQAVLDEEQHA